MIIMQCHNKLHCRYSINEKVKSSYINTSANLLTPRICGGGKCPNYKRFLLVRTTFNVSLNVKIDIYINERSPNMHQISINYNLIVIATFAH